MLKKTAMIFAACTFVFGFIAGVGFTAYMTHSALSNPAEKDKKSITRKGLSC